MIRELIHRRYDNIATPTETGFVQNGKLQRIAQSSLAKNNRQVAFHSVFSSYAICARGARQNLSTSVAVRSR